MYKVLKFTGFLCLLFVLGCTSKNAAVPDLRESYSYSDNKPFGTSIAFKMVENAYPNDNINIVKDVITNKFDLSEDKNSLYLNISKNFLVKDYDGNLLLKFVKDGNTAFISAAYFDSSFFSKLYCTQNNASYQTSPFTFLEKTNTSLVQDFTLYSDSFSYFYKPLSNSFPELNADYARYLGINKNGDANMFVFFYGKGKFIFHNEPRALSNYFLLTKNNYLYMQSILKMLPTNPSAIYWDNYYPKLNYVRNAEKNEGSLWDSIKNATALLSAFFIILGLFFLYLLFNSKRKQRIVPVKKQNENTSIAFAQALAGLYLTKKDNKDLVDKIVTYFNEHIRSKYFFTTNINDNEYATMLSRKSGVPFEITNELTNAILQSNASIKITDQELLNFNALIEKFLKHKN